MDLRFRFRVAVILSAALLSPAGHAQLFRAYLAVDGLDTNPCTLQLPCRLLPAALAAVASGGEIWMLDSANYNASSVTVAKSVTILAVPGVVGSLVAHGGPALLISGDSHKVTVRNLVVVPLTGGTGTHGIHMTGLTLLRIENGVFANFGATYHAVLVTGGGDLAVTGSLFRDIGGSGVHVENGSYASVSRSTFTAVNLGVRARGAQSISHTRLVVSDSTFSSGQYGVEVDNTLADSTAKAFVTRCTFDGNTYPLYAFANVGVSELSFSYSMVVNNFHSHSQIGAASAIHSMGNNHVLGNTSFQGSVTPMPGS